MERKNHYSSLPPNYVTLAQLHERWLNQHNNNQNNNQLESQEEEKNQEQDQDSPKHNHAEQPHLQVEAPSNQSAYTSPPKKQKQYVVKIRSDPETNRLTAAVAPVTEIGDGKGKGSKSDKKIRKVYWKSKTENREGSGEGSGTTAKASGKGTIKVKEKENGCVKMNEVEERVRVLSINSGNGRQKGRLGKTNNGLQKKKVWVRKDEI